MSQQDNCVKTLTQLGLTTRQAEVYTAILHLGQATVKSIAQTLQIARAEVYRSTPTLQALGLIKKIIVSPTAFKATPLDEGLSILLERNAEKHKSIQNEAEQLLRNFKNHNGEQLSHEDAQYHLTSGFKAVKRDYTKKLSKTQTSKDNVLDWSATILSINENIEYFKKILKEGAKIRYITHVPEGEKIPETIRTLAKLGFFEIRSASTIPKAGLDIFDKKFVHIITDLNSNLKKIEVLRSNNPEVVDLAQDYFELKWKSAKKIC